MNMDENGEIKDEETISTETAKTEENSVDSPTVPASERPLKRDPITGKFIAGTGSRGHLGGRPKGAKDRVSRQMLDIAQSLLERRGAELLEEVADRAPSEALALITRIIPASELTALFNEERAEESGGRNNDVRISVVAAPERLQDTRSQAQIDAQQRGLTQRIERPTEPVEDVVATQDDRDAEVAQNRREQARRYKDVSASPGYKRGQKSDSTVYLDDPVEDEGDALRDLYDRGDYL